MRDPGEMRERIELQRPIQTRGPGGGPATGFETLRPNVPARKLTERGLEVFAGARFIGKVEMGVAIRYWPGHGLDARHRFFHEGRIFNIVSVVESERRSELILLGTAGANDG